MLTPTQLTVRGFRGFRGEHTFEFSSPVTILFGANRCGKSSTLNALEWCLFGDQCKGKDTTIRERIGWVIANQHLPTPDVQVELRLTGPGGEWVVRRRLSQPAGKRSLVEELEVECPDGEIVSGPPAEQLLAQALRLSFRDFSTTVYQHQETIRGILTQEPRERNDALDRLLGLSDYRNLLSGIAAANPKRHQKDADASFTALEERIQTAGSLVRQQLEESRREAEDAGVPGSAFTERTALEIAGALIRDLQQFVEEIGLKASRGRQPPDSPENPGADAPGSLDLPARWQDLSAFEKAVQNRINQLRAALPDQEEQSRLYQRQTAIRDRITDGENVSQQLDELGKQVQELDSRHGGWQSLVQRLAQIEKGLNEHRSKQKEVSGRHQVLVEAVAYLQESELGQAQRCPVCESESEDLLHTLRHKLEQTLQGKLDQIQQTIASLQTEGNVLEKTAREYEKCDRQRVQLEEEKQKLAQQVGELLGRELLGEDNPVALLKIEQGCIARRLQELVQLIGARQERLTRMEGELDRLRRVRQVLQQAEKQKNVETIKQAREYRELIAERDRLDRFVNDLQEIKRAISEAAHQVAGQKLKAASTAIDQYFRQLSGNPAVRQIVLELKEDRRSGRNVYTVTDQDGRDLTPILSQGDLNALALAIFLGLASTAGATAPLGFVMLDDPSQSLGARHKSNLAAVLDQVSQTRPVLLATMDGEFRDCLDKRLTRAKTTYVFEDWTPRTGPVVRRQ